MLAFLPWLSFGANGEGSQFLFDPNGNLLVQTAATTAPPQILGQPQSRTVAPGEATSFSVVVSDTRALIYQWQFNGTNIAGATNDAALVRNAGTGDEGEYRVVLTHPSGSVTSALAMLWIDSDSDGMPDSWERFYFSGLNQNATADFDKDGVPNVTEFFDNTNPTNRLSARFTLTVLAEGEGVAEATPRAASYTNGQAVTLTATPAGTNQFYAWTGGIRSTSNPLLLTLTSNTTVRARFAFVPLEIVWTNTPGGDWHSATNWSPNQVPGASDNAFIPLATTVTINSPAECLGLTLGNGPTLTGGGTLMVHGTLQWTQGTMSGPGRTILNTNGVANISSLSTVSSRTFENRGTVLVYNTGVLNVTQGAVVTNCAGALFQVVNDAPSLGGGLANGRFDNAGSFVKSSGSGTLTVNPGLGFNNSGTVAVQTGLWACQGGFTNAGAMIVSAGAGLRLASGGSSTGSFLAPEGALVEWTGGTFTMNTGTQFDGDGVYRINAGTLLASADISIRKLELRSGTLGGTGTLTITNEMTWTGGGMSGGGRTLISTEATLNAALPSGGSLNGWTLENGGTVRWTGSGNLGFVNAVITNRAGGIFHAQGPGGIAFVSGLNRFDNAGTFRKSENPGTLEIQRGGSFNNFGTLEIQAGAFLCNASFTNHGSVLLSSATTSRLGGGGAASGRFEAPPEALVEWTGGTFTLNPGAQLGGSGIYRVNGINATVLGNGDLPVDNMELVNGSSTWGGSGRLTINSAMRWTAGTMEGDGRTLISPTATLFLSVPNNIGLKRILENGGTVEWTGPGVVGLLNGVITNRVGGVFQALNTGRLAFSGGACRFDNAGTFRKLGEVGTAVLDAGVPFSNSGTVDLRNGVLAASGGFFSSSKAVLKSALRDTAPGSGYGQLRVGGAAALDGELQLDFTNGFIPSTNDSFTILTAGARNGAFAAFTYPSNIAVMQLSNTPVSVVANVTGLRPPELVLLPPIVTSSNVTFCWRAEPNKTYQLEFNPDLNLAHWTAVPGNPVALGDNSCVSDVITSSNRFYRVRTLP